MCIYISPERIDTDNRNKNYKQEEKTKKEKGGAATGWEGVVREKLSKEVDITNWYNNNGRRCRNENAFTLIIKSRSYGKIVCRPINTAMNFANDIRGHYKALAKCYYFDPIIQHIPHFPPKEKGGKKRYTVSAE